MKQFIVPDLKILFFTYSRASSMRNLEASLTWKEDILNECFDEKKTVQERNKNLDLDLDKKLANLVNLQGANVSFLFLTFSKNQFMKCLQ